MRKIYLSGCISKDPDYMQKFSRAEEIVKRHFEQIGEECIVVNPASLPATCVTWQDYMIRDLLLLRDCDTIVMIPGWKNSDGANMEFLFASNSDKTAMYISGFDSEEHSLENMV